MGLLKDFIERCSAKMAEMESNYNSLQNEFKAFKKEPAAKPIANGKTEKFNNVSSDDLDDKISMIMAMRSTNK
jgi:hypothetical protein